MGSPPHMIARFISLLVTYPYKLSFRSVTFTHQVQMLIIYISPCSLSITMTWREIESKCMNTNIGKGNNSYILVYLQMQLHHL